MKTQTERNKERRADVFNSQLPKVEPTSPMPKCKPPIDSADNLNMKWYVVDIISVTDRNSLIVVTFDSKEEAELFVENHINTDGLAIFYGKQMKTRPALKFVVPAIQD